MIGNEAFSDGGVAEKNGVDAIIVKDGDFSDIG
jgi:putative hydrolase of the HAD superfamily